MCRTYRRSSVETNGTSQDRWRKGEGSQRAAMPWSGSSAGSSETSTFVAPEAVVGLTTAGSATSWQLAPCLQGQGGVAGGSVSAGCCTGRWWSQQHGAGSGAGAGVAAIEDTRRVVRRVMVQQQTQGPAAATSIR